jgi:hypothetical protein
MDIIASMMFNNINHTIKNNINNSNIDIIKNKINP